VGVCVFVLWWVCVFVLRKLSKFAFSGASESVYT
jgi:hypothetical protein